ncbi:MAG: phosphoglycerate dehydrogenase [Sphaerochaetaceae bacterium]
MKRKILITTSSFSQVDDLADYELIMNSYHKRLTEDEVLDLIERHQPDGIIAGVEPLTERVLSHAQKLKIISRCGVGLDNIDFDSAKKYKIVIKNTPNAPTQAVAEMTVALMLSWLRNIPSGDRALKKNEWQKKTGCLLGGKTIGIIGCGRIGTRVASLIKPFGVVLLGYDPYCQKHDIWEMVELNQLLKKSDIISIHVPLTDITRNLIDAEALSLMKETALLVNTARGPIVDEEALYNALIQKKIGGAALDVFNEEPYTGFFSGLGDNVILSPHQSSNAIESRIQMENEAVANLIAFFQEI